MKQKEISHPSIHMSVSHIVVFRLGCVSTRTSPQNGATVEGSFDLVYSFREGLLADHVHVFIDGNHQKGFKGKFSDVPSGRHPITINVATYDHDVVK